MFPGNGLQVSLSSCQTTPESEIASEVSSLGNENKNWTLVLWSEILFSVESFAFHLEIKSKSLEEVWRGTERKLLKVQWEVSTVSDDLG